MHPSVALNLSRYAFAESIVRQNVGALISKTVFDVGSHDDRMCEQVSALGLTWVGFDLKPAGSNVVLWNLNDVCPVHDASPGMVLLLDVIEHLYNPGKAVANIATIMAPGALLVVTMPNPRWSRSRLHALLTGYPACFTESDLRFNHHVFTPWPHVIEHLLMESGFVIEQCVTLDGSYSWPAFTLSPKYAARLAHAAINKLIEWYDPSACGMSYAVVARRT
jgi:SAM-dependent methyltransferase